jgi:uncharacterized protein
MIGQYDDEDRVDISDIDFAWHIPKARSNLKKHKVSFEEAKSVFGDKKLVDFQDSVHSEDEIRYIGLGRSQADRLLFVNYTLRDEQIRIISARLAKEWERREYEIANRYE